MTDDFLAGASFEPGPSPYTVPQIIGTEEFAKAYADFLSYLDDCMDDVGNSKAEAVRMLDELLMLAHNAGFDEGVCK